MIPHNRSIAILLLLALVGAMATPVFWQWKQETLKFNAFERLEKEEQTELRLSITDWEKARLDEHELRWQGAMYDIVDFHVKGDSVVITAYRDQEEEWTAEQGQRSIQPIVLKVMGDIALPPSMPALVRISEHIMVLDSPFKYDCTWLSRPSGVLERPPCNLIS